MSTLAEAPADLKVVRLAGRLGAAVEGLDLSKPVDDGTMEALRRAFHAHLVLVFPGQGRITPAEHVAFARRWGELQVMRGRNNVDGCPELIAIKSGANKHASDETLPKSVRLARTDIWHADQTYEPRPATASLLLARVLPSAGGDTMFANQYDAYEALSPGMKRLLEGRRAIHSGEGYYRLMGLDPRDAPVTAQPVVRIHPETGRPALYVNRVWTTRFEDMTVEESAPLLGYLYEHCASPCFTFRHRWSLGDLLIWDNRCVQHYAVHDYGDEPREMHRATVQGEVPY